LLFSLSTIADKLHIRTIKWQSPGIFIYPDGRSVQYLRLEGSQYPDTGQLIPWYIENFVLPIGSNKAIVNVTNAQYETLDKRE